MNEDEFASQIAFTEERRKGARRAMRLALLHRMSSIEAEFRQEFGPASPEFSAVRRFSDAVSTMIEAVSAADED